MDDPFRPCFDCNNADARSSFYTQKRHQYIGRKHNYYYIERQSRETFEATSKSSRIICPSVAEGVRLCRIRISRAVQFRRKTYRRAQKFVHAEEYLSFDDLEII